MSLTESTNAQILVVEDDPAVREVVGGVLESYGYRVTSAANGQEALTALGNGRPDLILSDVRMPQLDGFGLLKAVRENPRWFNTPFVIVSGKTQTSDVRMGMTLGADDYVTKPYEPENLHRTLEVRLERARKLRRVEKRQQEFLLRTLPHELRTPLTGILGYSELMVAAADLGAGLSNEELKEYGEGIKLSGERLYSVVKNFLLWAQIEGTRSLAGGNLLQMHKEYISKSGLQSVCQTLGSAYGRLNDFRILDFDDVAISVAVPGFITIAQQLIDNAFKYSLPGQRVHVSCEITASMATLVVRDYGRGMSQEDIAKVDVFRQFNRLKNEQQGLGLGLALAASFAEVSGGSLELRPEAQGVTARLSLPRCVAIAPAAGGTALSIV